MSVDGGMACVAISLIDSIENVFRATGLQVDFPKCEPSSQMSGLFRNNSVHGMLGGQRLPMYRYGVSFHLSIYGQGCGI